MSIYNYAAEIYLCTFTYSCNGHCSTCHDSLNSCDIEMLGRRQIPYISGRRRLVVAGRRYLRRSATPASRVVRQSTWSNIRRDANRTLAHHSLTHMHITHKITWLHRVAGRLLWILITLRRRRQPRRHWFVAVDHVITCRAAVGGNKLSIVAWQEEWVRDVSCPSEWVYMYGECVPHVISQRMRHAQTPLRYWITNYIW